VYVGHMQLSRERIITAAVELIEREGVEAVSMRLHLNSWQFSQFLHGCPA
jgi:hypothetical protein